MQGMCADVNPSYGGGTYVKIQNDYLLKETLPAPLPNCMLICQQAKEPRRPPHHLGSRVLTFFFPRIRSQNLPHHHLAILEVNLDH